MIEASRTDPALLSDHCGVLSSTASRDRSSPSEERLIETQRFDRNKATLSPSVSPLASSFSSRPARGIRPQHARRRRGVHPGERHGDKCGWRRHRRLLSHDGRGRSSDRDGIATPVSGAAVAVKPRGARRVVAGVDGSSAGESVPGLARAARAVVARKREGRRGWADFISLGRGRVSRRWARRLGEGGRPASDLARRRRRVEPSAAAGLRRTHARW